ncbi:dnaJ homolog subfamily C member 24-like [Anopheles aquasalis]|uniref:dnaJ homolog subfamily C member 24-like n=1 Tax=Anopheles aquasalis TaxID=42839 RepID=UPI00215AC65A|nr:dnaJ homolog subfamily C member 24-like [Anopheles aquasalis]
MSESSRNQGMSHYEVLQVRTDATMEEIRKSYQTLALQYHPDKRKGGAESSEAGNFIRIDEAWKVLRDEQTRRVYDAELMQQSCQEEYFINEIVMLGDFEKHQEEDYRFHVCRCGGFYILPDEPIREKTYVSCDECSLVVQNLKIFARKRLIDESTKG